MDEFMHSYGKNKSTWVLLVVVTLFSDLAFAGPGFSKGVGHGPQYSTFAGDISTGTAIDGMGTNASFASPHSVAVDGAGNVYVADFSNHKIRKITPSGAVSTLAGSGTWGYIDGTGAAASFYLPKGVAVDSSGNVFVADTYNNRIRKITPAGVVTTLAGSGACGATDDVGINASFCTPGGLVVDSTGNIFVADTGKRRIRKITPAGVVTTLAGSNSMGSTDGIGTAASFYFPFGMAIDSSGNLYVSDYGNHRIRKITPDAVVSTFAGGIAGSFDATGTAARFSAPYGIAVDASGNAYVADSNNNEIRKIAPDGVVTTIAGSSLSGSTDANGTSALFSSPRGIAVDASGNLYVGDTSNGLVRKITPAADVTTIAGSGSTGSSNATGSAARFNLPQGIAIDASGNMYVADSYNHLIRKITSAGVVTTFAGSGAIGSTNATGTSASFNEPSGIAIDSTGNLYVADRYNHLIRKISSAGVVTTFAGTNGTCSTTDGTGTAAAFCQPYGIALDGAGNVYVSDRGNYTVRKITPAGVVTTLAGSGGVTGTVNGFGTAARFNYTEGLAVDLSGNVYVSDYANHMIRKITSAGLVSTLAGTSGSCGSTNGTGTAAKFCNPKGVTLDSAGNVYVADNGSWMIRKITPAGVVTTVAGSSQSSPYCSGCSRTGGVAAQGILVSGSWLYISTSNGIAKFALP